jgi:GTP:adenosylcobinamide-phosphate guanylyltransferase
MTTMKNLSVLVLAGQRSGTLDPLARDAGVSHKCLVPLLGQSLIGRVLTSVDQALPLVPIYVSIEDPLVLRGDPTVDRLHQAGRLQIVASKYNLVDSVWEASTTSGFPLLITTADNVLVTAEALQRLAKDGQQGEADAILVMASKQEIEKAHSGGKGRYYEFRDGGYSNCNLFWLRSATGLNAAEAFREGGQFLKVAGRFLRAFGLLNLVLFRLKVLTLKQAFGAASRRLGVKVRPLVLADGRLAIDVDDERSRKMAEELLSTKP